MEVQIDTKCGMWYTITCTAAAVVTEQIDGESVELVSMGKGGIACFRASGSCVTVSTEGKFTVLPTEASAAVSLGSGGGSEGECTLKGQTKGLVITLGKYAYVDSDDSGVAIGYEAAAGCDSISIGNFAQSESRQLGEYNYGSISVGHQPMADEFSISIGYSSTSSTQGISIGHHARSTGGGLCISTSTTTVFARPGQVFFLWDVIDNGTVVGTGRVSFVSHGTRFTPGVEYYYTGADGVKIARHADWDQLLPQDLLVSTVSMEDDGTQPALDLEFFAAAETVLGRPLKDILTERRQGEELLTETTNNEQE